MSDNNNFYSDRTPSINSIVTVEIDLANESEHCIYVKLLEYSNMNGIIPKSSLPAKKKFHDKMLKSMKQKLIIPCIVVSNTDSSMIDLTIKNIEPATHDIIMNRFKNVEKLCKIIKYLELELNQLSELKLDKTKFYQAIQPLKIEDSDINDYNDLVNTYLSNHTQFVDIFLNDDFPTEIKTKLYDVLKSSIRETKSTSSLKFDLYISKYRAIYLIRELFLELMKSNDVNIEYIGSPTYMINCTAVGENQINMKYESIYQQIKQWLVDKNLNESDYELIYDVSKKEIKKGDISVHFSYNLSESIK
jgi:translation initiation factor 2 alpha subunit (eIF-2alpha)